VRVELGQPIICVVGLGYVGLPLAKAFSLHFKVIGFDTDNNRVKELNRHNNNQDFTITDAPELIKKADFIIVTVPTPVTKSKDPDLSYITSAARTISQNMKTGCTVILESTVYPGVTEDIVKPILNESGMQCGQDFKIAYSPERINPGDAEHTIDKVTKVVSGIDEETTEVLAQLYGRVCHEVYRARDIKTAEAAKVIENVQRDLNIALVNELCLIFDRMGLSIKDVLDAAATKWNFYRFSPGLVGGHCIPVDPYYLVYKAEELGYHPQVILAGRAINDSMPRHVVQMTIKGLNSVSKVINGSRVLIMGLTYKENVADTRETPAGDIIKELREYGVRLYGYDPLLNDIKQEFSIEAVSKLNELTGIDCVILTVNHDVFQQITISGLKTIVNKDPVLIDVHRFFDETEAKIAGFHYKSL
jgi:UDP-N-acetyl-D-galactosamine dehydrogenase